MNNCPYFNQTFAILFDVIKMSLRRNSLKIKTEAHGLTGAVLTGSGDAAMSPLIRNGAAPAPKGTYLRGGETL